LSSTHLIVASGVGVSLGDNFELHPLDFDASPGQVVGILGPNGSGKTTLLRLLAGAIEATQGRVEFKGINLAEWSPRDLAQSLAVVPQKSELQFPFTTEQVVLFGRTPYLSGLGFERERDRQVANEAMALTHVAHLRGRMFPNLSGGEQQRVCIARGLAQEPELLLLDEPTASLDLQHRVSVFQLLKQRARSGLSVVVVLHDLNLAAQWCDRLYLLKDGALFAAGDADQVLTAETILEVFSVEVSVLTHPKTGHRVFVPDVTN
jgi:iron complex transport system ATP-binding protein